MKIISIEGLDKAGKHTAQLVLEHFFKSYGWNVKCFGTPNYESPMGELIMKWLKGEFQADEKTFELLQCADKQHAQRLFYKWEQQGVDIVLIDRYVHSQWAYGAVDNDREWLKELTKYMRRPDYVLYLDVEPEVSEHRKGKFGDNDRYEADIERLRKTREEYHRLLFEEKRDGIPCVKVDANQPQPIVKAEIFKVAKEWLREWTGEQVTTDGLDEMVATVRGDEAFRVFQSARRYYV